MLKQHNKRRVINSDDEEEGFIDESGGLENDCKENQVKLHDASKVNEKPPLKKRRIKAESESKYIVQPLASKDGSMVGFCLAYLQHEVGRSVSDSTELATLLKPLLREYCGGNHDFARLVLDCLFEETVPSDVVSSFFSCGYCSRVPLSSIRIAHFFVTGCQRDGYDGRAHQG